MINEEEWKVIEENPSYMVSNLGRVKGLEREIKYKDNRVRIEKEKIIKGCINDKGYRFVELSLHNKVKFVAVHRLVAKAFIPNPLNKKCINHIDCNRTNNCVENLEWCTYKENMQHALKLGRMKTIKRPVLKIKNGKVIARYESCNQALKDNGICRNQLFGALKSHNTDKNGFNWQYA